MVFLIGFSLLSGFAILAVIWYAIYVYTNKWIATFIALAIAGIAISLLLSWINEPTPEEVNNHIRKTLNV